MNRLTLNPANCGAVILAAGQGSRMNQAKQCLSWRGQTLLSHSVGAARRPGLGSVTVVLGAHFEATREEANRLQVDSVFNPDWQTGMASSVVTGLNHLLAQSPQRPEAVLVLLADQPLVDAQSVKKLLIAANSGDASLVAASYAQTMGVPALFGSRYFPELLALQGEAGAKHVLFRWKEQVIRVSLPEAGCDLDTPEQYGEFTQNNSS